MKAAILTHVPTDWMFPAIRSLGSGLSDAQNLPFRFQNYMFASDLLRLLRFVKLTTDLAVEAFASFLLLLRLPSGTPQLRLSPGYGNLAEFTPHGHMVLAGIRMVNSPPALLAKFP